MDTKTAMNLVKKYGTSKAAAEAAGVSRHVIFRALKKGRISAECGSAEKRKTLTSFRELYDRSFIVPKRIKAALKMLGNGWEYEVDFAKLAGVSLSELSTHRDDFPDNVVQIGRDGRRAWAGTKSLAAQMRNMI